MAEYDGSIRLSVNLTPGNVKESARRLQKEIEKVFKVSSGTTDKGLQRILSQMDKAYTRAQELQDQMASLADQEIPTEEYQEIVKQIEAAEKQLASFEARQEEMRDFDKTSGTAWDKLVYKIDQARNTIEYAKGELQDLVDTGKAFTLGADSEQYQTLAQKLGTVNNQMRVLVESAGESDKVDRFGSAVSTLGNAAQKAVKKLAALVQSLLKLAASKVSSGINRLKNAILGLGKSASSSNLSASRLLKTLLMYSVGVRGLYALFNKLKSAIATGFERIAEFQGGASELGTAISGLKNNLTYLQNAWAAAFAPIATYVIPLINQLITASANLANYLGAAMSILTGKQVMVKAVQNMDGYGEMTAKAAKEQKKLNAELYSFDDLNRQSSKDTGAVSGAENMFVEVPISDSLPAALEDWVKRLKELWNDEKYFDVGTHLADLMNKGIENLDNWINNTFRPWATKWAGNIAEVLNGVVARLDWKNLGNTFADGVAAVLDTASTFLERFRFDELGRGISQALQGIFDNKDMWAQLARFLSDGFNSMVDMAWGFLTESLPHMFDWGDTIGSTLMDTLNNIKWQRLAEVIVMGFESITLFLEGFLSDKAKWDEFAKKFTDAFSYVVENVDTEQLGKDVNELLERIITLLSELDWETLGIKVGEFLGQIDWLDILMKLGGIIFKFFKGVFEGLFGSEHGTAFLLLLALLKGLPLVFGLALPGLKTAAGGFLTNGLVNVISKGASAVSGAFGTVTSIVGSGISGLAGALEASPVAMAATAVFDAVLVAYDAKALYDAGKTYNETQEAINNETKTTLDGYAKLYNEKGKEVADEYAKMVADIDTTGMSFEEAQAALADKISHEYDGVAKNMWEGFKMGWNDYFGEGGKGLSGLIGDAFTMAVDGVKSLLGIHSPSTVFEGIGGNIVDGLLGGLKKWSEVPKFLSDSWSKLVSGFKEKPAQWLSIGTDTINKLKSGISQNWSGVTSFLNTSWSNLVSSFNAKKSQWVSVGSNIANGIKSGISSAWSAVTTTIGNLCSSAVSKAKSALQISSPSRVFAQIGEYVGLGLAEGIDGTEEVVEKSVNQLVKDVSDPDIDLENPIDYDSIIPGLDSAIERLSRLAGIFGTISQSFADIASIPIPAIAMGRTVPYQVVTGGKGRAADEYDEGEGSLLMAIRDLVDSIRSNGNSDTERVVQININGREVFNAVVNENNSVLARTGYSPLRA